LSKISGVATRSITQIEAGKGNPTLATIEALLRPMGLKVSVITSLKNPPVS
jgi:transcriptional regulator with XRE-family HTH domain